MIVVCWAKLVFDNDNPIPPKITRKQIATKITDSGLAPCEFKVHPNSFAEQRKVVGEPRSKVPGFVWPYVLWF
jgi:hypothetical protein